MLFHLLTIFPEFFGSPAGTGVLGHGVVARALRSGIAQVDIHDLRSFTHDRHRTVDDRPFGGGEGMVLKPQPIFECLESLAVPARSARPSTTRVILLSAQGRKFTQADARRLAACDRIVLICGRYEGVDERIAQHLCDEELCIGDYVLSGGELPAAILIDAITRLLPGVLGHADSSRYESFGEADTPAGPAADPGAPGLASRTGDTAGAPGLASETWVSREVGAPGLASRTGDTAGAPGLASETWVSREVGAPGLASETWVSREAEETPIPPRSTNASAGILDYPHYTRPADWQGLPVPEPLHNGDHASIRRWRRHAALAKTLANRPDLLTTADLSDDDRDYLATLGYTS
jgi:tRNA (guanine37-N1)-methyltransferase